MDNSGPGHLCSSSACFILTQVFQSTRPCDGWDSTHLRLSCLSNPWPSCSNTHTDLSDVTATRWLPSCVAVIMMAMGRSQGWINGAGRARCFLFFFPFLGVSSLTTSDGVKSGPLPASSAAALPFPSLTRFAGGPWSTCDGVGVELSETLMTSFDFSSLGSTGYFQHEM